MKVKLSCVTFAGSAGPASIAVLAFLVTIGCCLACAAQEPPKPAGSPPDESQEEVLESQAQKEARSLEKELVRMARKLLEKSKRKPASLKGQEKEETTRAAMPEPEQADAEALRNQLAEWKSKSLAMADVLKHQKLADLDARHEQKVKKLAEAVRKRERVVINPGGKRRGDDDEEAERLERAIEKEMDKLEREYEAEERKIEREARREKDFIERLEEELRRAVLPEEEKERKKKTHRPKNENNPKKKGEKPRKKGLRK